MNKNIRNIHKISKVHALPLSQPSFESTLSWTRYFPLVIFLSVLGLYCNSLWGDFVLDDAIVISDNSFTQKGVGGIKEIFSYDTFYGFFKQSGKDQLVAGGRYRPLSLAMFAVEGSLFGNSPFTHHLFNLFFYAFTCILVFYYVIQLLKNDCSDYCKFCIAASVSLIFAFHPIHTEVVANIKGRDEILTMFFGLLALQFFLKSVDFSSWKYAIISSIALCLAILSKENGITFIFCAPLCIYFLEDIN